MIDLIIWLNEMGFKEEIVEWSIVYGGATCIEEIMYYILPDEDGIMEHEFIPDTFGR